MNNYLKTLIYKMAELNSVSLENSHFKILEFAYYYYKKHKVGPLYDNIRKNTGYGKEDIEKLFPNGLNSVYSWIGIPIQTIDKGCKPIASIKAKNFREVYFDYNATTPIRKEIKEYIKKLIDDDTLFGNPSSGTTIGERAYDLIDNARAEIASTLNVHPSNICFTSCGTEAINLAIKGLAFSRLEKKGIIISNPIEHHAVLNSLSFLEKLGFQILYIKILEDGNIDLNDLEEKLKLKPFLCCVMAANNEIGTISPLKEIGSLCSKYGVVFFVDAVQAYGKIEIKPIECNIDLLAASGHKIYAPKGIGFLYAAENIKLAPLLHGGEQEFGLRSGTENVIYASALGKAAKLAFNEMNSEFKRLKAISSYFVEKLNQSGIEYKINGPIENRLPNNLNITFKDIDSGSLLLSLNSIGAYVSSGSACSSGSKEISHVIKAIEPNNVNGAIRFSFGLYTTFNDIDYLFEYLPIIVNELHRIEKV